MSQTAIQRGDYVPSSIVKVRPENLEFVSPEDEVRFVIPSSGGKAFFDPAGSYLEGRFRMTGRLAGRPAPDPKAGIHACVRNLTIRDFSDSQILDSTEDYNVLSAITREYSKAPSVSHARELFEIVQENPAFESLGATVLYKAHASADTMTSLRGSDAGTKIEGSAVLESAGQLSPYFKCHLNSGIFQSEKIFPSIACGGIRITMDMETAKRSIVLPRGEATPGRGPANAIPTVASAKTIPSDEKTTPTQQFSVNTGVNFGSQDIGIGIGDIIYISDTAGTNEAILGVCMSLTNNAGKYQVNYVPQRAVGERLRYAYAAVAQIYYKESDRTSDITTVEDWNQTSTSLETRNIVTMNGENQTLFAPSWRIDDIRMCLRVVSPPQGMVGAVLAKSQREGIMYQIMANTLYRHNMTSIEGESSQIIPATQTMAKSILSQPLDQAHFQDYTTSSLVMATPDGADQYQYVYGSQLIPRRRVKTTKYNTAVGESSRVEPIHLTEVQKALINSDHSVRDLHGVRHKFVIGRALNRYNAISDISKETLSLNVTYVGGTQTKIYQHRVFGLRQLMLKLSGVEVIE